MPSLSFPSSILTLKFSAKTAKAMSKSTADSDDDDPLPEEEMLRIEKIIMKVSGFYLFYLLISHSSLEKAERCLLKFPRRVVEHPYKLAYQKSPLKNVFGSDGVDKFDGDDNEDEDHDHEGPSMKARYVIHEHLLSSFLIPLRVPVVLVPLL